MKYLGFLFFSLFSFFSVQAQFPVSPNATTENGLRTGQWTILYDSVWKPTTNQDSAFYYRLARFENGKPVGKVRDFYRAGQKQWDGYMLSISPDVMEGECKSYHENGKVKAIGTYKSGLLQGAYRDYNAKGILTAEGTFTDDEATGIWKYYEDTGTLLYQAEYKGGKENGTMVIYFETGKVKSKGNMRDGLREGVWETFHANGKVEIRAAYVKGKYNGFSEEYYENGQLKEKGLCKDGYYFGFWTHYSPSGKKEMEGNYNDDGRKTGLWKKYAEDGTLVSEFEMKQGGKEGVYTAYYANGKIDSTGTYVDDDHRGRWSYFYETGQLQKTGAFYHTDSTEGKWMYYHANGNLEAEGIFVRDIKEGVWNYYFENGKIKISENTIKGKLHGEWTQYYDNGGIQERRNYKLGQLDGGFNSYHENGAVKATGSYNMGLKNGQWLKYYSDGSLDEKVNYDNGLFNGDYYSYFEGGKIYEKGRYENGKKVGAWDRYYKNGQSSLQSQYTNGGYTWVEFYDTGIKKSDGSGTGTGADDKQDGVQRKYYQNGILKNEGKNLNGLPEGRFVFYDSLTGRKDTEGSFVHGKYDGVWKYYTTKGKVNTTSYFINGFRETINNVKDSIEVLNKIGEYDLAVKHLDWLNKVLKRDASKNDVRWSTATRLQADIYYGRREYEKALSTYQQFAREAQKMEGDTSYRYQLALNGIANCYTNLSRHAEALQINEELLKHWNSDNNLNYPVALFNKALSLSYLNRGDEGEHELKVAWETKVKQLGDTSIFALSILEYLSWFQHDYQHHYTDAIKGYLFIVSHVTESDPRYLKMMRNLSAAYVDIDNDKEATTWLQKAVDYQVEKKMDVYSGYYEDMSKLSLRYYNDRQFTESLNTITEALAAIRKYGKGETYEGAVIFHRASFIFLETGYDKETALTAAERAKEILEKIGRQNATLYDDVLDQLANCHYNSSLTYAQAEQFYIQSIAYTKKNSGENSTYYNDLLALANYYTNGFKLNRADSVLRVAHGFTAKFDSTSFLHPRYERLMADVQIYQYKYSEALLHYEVALKFYEQTEGKESANYASMLQAEAFVYDVWNKNEEADKLLRQAISIQEKRGDVTNPDFFYLKEKLADVLTDQLLYKDAEKILLEVIKSTDDMFGQDHSKYRALTFKLGQLYTKMNEYKKAEDYLKQSMALSVKNTSATPEEDYYQMLEAMAKLKVMQREIPAAEGYYRQAKVAAAPYPNSVSYYLFLQQYGLFSMDNTHYAQAAVLFTEALAITKNLAGEKHWFYASVALDLAKAYLQLGKNGEAEQMITKAMAMTEQNKEEDQASYITTLRSLAQILQRMGRYGDAEKLHYTIIAYVEKVEGRSTRYATELLDLASLNLDWNRDEKVKELITELMLIYEDNLAADHENVLTAYNQLAVACLALNQLDEAEKHIRYCIEKREANGRVNTSQYTINLNNLGAILMRQGKFADAEQLYKKSQEIRTSNKMETSLSGEAGLLDDFAVLYQSWGKDELAEKYWKEALQKMLLYIRTNFSFLSDYEKAKFWEKNKKDFEYFNTFAVHRAEKNPLILTDMYNYRLATKGILLSASNKLRKRIYASRDSVLINQYQQWTELREQAAKAYTLVATDQKTPHIDSLERSINALEKELSISTEDGKADRDQLITWKEVQRSLAQDEAAVEFIRFHYFNKTLTDSVVYAALIITTETKTNPKLVIMGNGDFLETKAYRYYRNSIVTQLDDEQSYLNFWAAIEPLVSNKKRVYLSLDGVFNQVNLKTLKTPDGTYLMDRKDFVIVSNTRDLIAMKSRKKLRLMETASLIGNPKFFIGGQSKAGQTRDVNEEDRSGIVELPGTKVEIEAVGTMLDANGWKVNSLVQNEASEEHMKQLPSSRVVHLATHGFFQDEKNASWSTKDPMLRSGILLTGAANFMQNKQETDGENGILTAYEAANLSLEGTEMVVLSACETARGEIQQGEGVYGLQRAFITAGAESLVMSLWKVDDEATQKLMSLFYENWMKGMEKSEALNQAQRTLKNLYPHPYYWGAFVMMRG